MRGTPFREAHAVVGQLVRRHLAGEGALRELVAADGLGPDAAALVAPGRRRRASARRRAARPGRDRRPARRATAMLAAQAGSSGRI